MTLCALPSAVKNARVPAASVAMHIASTARISIFRFIVRAPLRLMLPNHAPWDKMLCFVCCFCCVPDHMRTPGPRKLSYGLPARAFCSPVGEGLAPPARRCFLLSACFPRRGKCRAQRGDRGIAFPSELLSAASPLPPSDEGGGKAAGFDGGRDHRQYILMLRNTSAFSSPPQSAPQTAPPQGAPCAQAPKERTPVPSVSPGARSSERAPKGKDVCIGLTYGITCRC